MRKRNAKRQLDVGVEIFDGQSAVSMREHVERGGLRLR